MYCDKVRPPSAWGSHFMFRAGVIVAQGYDVAVARCPSRRSGPDGPDEPILPGIWARGFRGKAPTTALSWGRCRGEVADGPARRRRGCGARRATTRRFSSAGAFRTRRPRSELDCPAPGRQRCRVGCRPRSSHRGADRKMVVRPDPKVRERPESPTRERTEEPAKGASDVGEHHVPQAVCDGLEPVRRPCGGAGTVELATDHGGLEVV